jgi:hypothetical protein
MDRVFIVMAEERGYCSHQWVCGVFSGKEAAEEHRDKAQAKADEVHAKIRALGEDEGIPATWRDVCIPKDWAKAREDCHHHVWLEEVHKFKKELFPEDPDAQIEWDCTMHYSVQEWGVDDPDHRYFPVIRF